MKTRMIFAIALIGFMGVFAILLSRNDMQLIEVDSPSSLIDSAHNWFLERKEFGGIHTLNDADDHGNTLYILVNQEPGQNLYVHYDMDFMYRNGILDLYIQSRNAVDDSEVKRHTLFMIELPEEPSAISVYLDGGIIEVSRERIE